jgi:hypothetical protein
MQPLPDAVCAEDCARREKFDTTLREICYVGLQADAADLESQGH